MAPYDAATFPSTALHRCTGWDLHALANRHVRVSCARIVGSHATSRADSPARTRSAGHNASGGGWASSSFVETSLSDAELGRRGEAGSFPSWLVSEILSPGPGIRAGTSYTRNTLSSAPEVSRHTPSGLHRASVGKFSCGASRAGAREAPSANSVVRVKRATGAEDDDEKSMHVTRREVEASPSTLTPSRGAIERAGECLTR